MTRIRGFRLSKCSVALAIAVSLGIDGCGGDGAASQGAKTAAQAPSAGGRQTAGISRIDPCSLLTKDEVQQQEALAYSPSQLAALESKGVVWSINMESQPRGVSRACHITWQGKVNGEVSTTSDFDVVVTFADWLKGSVAAMKHPLPIPNIGDEAHIVGGASGPAYARVGDVAIGIENFPGSKDSKPRLDLLRAAVSRARKR
jgi:hypothetical protein